MHRRIRVFHWLANIKTAMPRWHWQRLRLCRNSPVTASQIETGLKNVDWPGRLQMIERPDGRKFLLDGAHNIAGAQALRKTIERDFPSGKRILILGIFDDKNWGEICKILVPLAGEILAVPVSSKRTADPAKLAEVSQAVNPSAKILVCSSLADAMRHASAENLTIITGSLYLIGEALELLGYFPATASERELNEWGATSPPTAR